MFPTTYSRLSIGWRPESCRAEMDSKIRVASMTVAIAINPVGYLIPCHRVIAKTGSIHRYRWGAARKKALAAWEAARAG
jgi:O-6-methylguanine DNA methyltransferase